jgi:hypothetical protein
MLGMPLSMLGVDGVVGLELLSRYPLTLADGGVWMDAVAIALENHTFPMK